MIDEAEEELRCRCGMHGAAMITTQRGAGLMCPVPGCKSRVTLAWLRRHNAENDVPASAVGDTR